MLSAIARRASLVRHVKVEGQGVPRWKMSFSPNCIWRGVLTVDLTVPNSVLPRLHSAARTTGDW